MITKFKLFEGSVKSAERIDIFRDNKYILVAPLTAKASMKYGAFTHWCTSVSDGSYMEIWDSDNIPNTEYSDTALLILIKKEKLTQRNIKNSELYYYLNKKKEDGETLTKKEYEKLDELTEDDDFVNLSKLCIIFTIYDDMKVEAWSANNVNLQVSNLYDLISYGIDNYIIDKIQNHIEKIQSRKLVLSE